MHHAVRPGMRLQQQNVQQCLHGPLPRYHEICEGGMPEIMENGECKIEKIVFNTFTFSPFQFRSRSVFGVLRFDVSSVCCFVLAKRFGFFPVRIYDAYRLFYKRKVAFLDCTGE